MIKKIANTVGTQLFISLVSLALSIVYSNTLGKDGVAEIALIVLGFSIITMINTLLGSTSIIYLGSRVSVYSILFLSYLWIIFFSVVTTGVLYYFNLIPHEYTVYIGIIAFFESLTTIHNQVLLSKQEVKKYNVVRLVQKLLLLAFIVSVFFIIDIQLVSYFVWACLFSTGVVSILSFFLIFKYIGKPQYSNLKPLFIKKIAYGSQIQFSALFSLLTNRLSYYLIEKLHEPLLGVFAQGASLMENNLIVARSISLVQVSSISNSNDKNQSEQLTLLLFKLSGILTLVMVTVMVVIPEWIYLWVFSEEFVGIKEVIYVYAPTILLISLGTIFIHYFSGIAKYYYSTLVSFIGLIVNLISCFYFIPEYGIIGAGVSLIITNGVILFILLYLFIKTTDVRFKDLLISKSDIIKGKQILKDRLRRESH